MNFFAFSSYLIVFSNLLIAIFLFWKVRKRKVGRILNLFCLTAILWGLGASIFSTTISKEIALFGWQVAYTGSMIAPIFYSHFVLAILKEKKNYLIFCSYLLGLIFLFFIWYDNSRLFTGDLSFMFNQFYYTDWPKQKNLIYLIFYIAFYWILLGYSFFLLLKAYIHSTGSFRNQLKYFILGSIMGWAGAHGDFPCIFRIFIYPYANILIAIYPAIWAYAIIKHQLMDIRVAITRAGIFLGVYSLVLGIPFWIGYQTKNWFIPTLSMCILSTTGPLIYRYFQGKAENILLANQRHYQRLLLEAAKGMLRVHSLDRLLKLVIDIVKKTVKIKFAAVILKDPNKKHYILKAVKGDKNFPRDLVLSDKDPLIKLLKKKKSSLVYDELNYFKNAIFDSQIQLIVPVFMENNLLGFLGMGEKEDHTLYTQDDINVFEILARQAALAIDHCHFMEEFSKAQEKAFQAEKLASIGGMADGVAHQMKNRLNFFSIVSGEMRSEIEDFVKTHPELLEQNPDLKRYFDYLDKTGDMIISNVRKTNGIIEGILSFARTGEKGGYFSQFSLREIIETSIGLLLIKHHIKEFPLEVDVNSSDLVYGVKSQFLECIYNLLDNCYEAITEKMEFYLTEDEKKSFRPLIRLRLTHNEKFYHIEISDNGTGIKEENRQKVFAPFFTTKPSTKSGSGVGMYVVKRIIEENHKGKIRFESQYMEGTKFFIKLPKSMGEALKSPVIVGN